MQEMEDGAGLHVGWEAERAMRLTPSMGLCSQTSNVSAVHGDGEKLAGHVLGFALLGLAKGISHPILRRKSRRDTHIWGPWRGDGV